MSDYGQGSYGQYHKPGSTQPYGYYHEGPRLPPSQDGYAPFPSQGLAGAQVGGPPSYHYSGPSRAYAPNHDAYGYNSSHVPEVRLPASMTPADAPPRYHESDGYPPRNSGPWMQQPPNDIYKRSTPYLPQENPRPPPQSHTASYHVEPFVPQPAYSGTFSSSRHHEERPEEPEIVLESVEKSTPKRMRDDLEEGELTESEEEPIRQQQTRSPPPSWPVQMVWEPQSERTRRNEYPADEARHQESRGHMPQLPSGIAPAGPTVYPQKIHSPHEETPSGRHNGQAVDESDFYSPHKPSLDFTPRKDIQPTARRHDKARKSLYFCSHSLSRVVFLS